jgi:hypothetical protein
MPSVARGTLLLLLVMACVLLVPGCLGPGGTKASQPLITTPALSPAPQPSQTPSPDPIIGKWYAPPPDDLTFEFFADGTFTERSPAFQPYHGTWAISEEGEEGFYDATVLDRWGYREQVHILITSGNLHIKSMGTLHRVW